MNSNDEAIPLCVRKMSVSYDMGFYFVAVEHFVRNRSEVNIFEFIHFCDRVGRLIGERPSGDRQDGRARRIRNVFTGRHR